MHGYEHDLDEEAGYEDYYSGDEDEYEDEEEEEEERQPPKEELEYLELRQKLKESIRKNMGKGSANAQSSQERRRKLPYNDFGSFFGPSRPVISSRVIQESKSLLENEIRTAKMSNSSQTKKRPVSTSGSGSKNVSQEKRPKVVNEVRRKVETLKDTRDYSFLFSDDAELPVPKKESLSRSVSFPNSGFLLMFKRLDLLNYQRGPNNHQVSMVELLTVPIVRRRDLFQRMGIQDRSQRPGSSTNRQVPMRPPGSGSTMNGQSANRNGQPNSRSDSQRSALAKVPVDHRKQMSSSNGVGPGRSASTARPLPLERKPSISGGKSSLQSAQRPSSSRPMSSDPRQRVVEQRKVSRDVATPRMIPKQSVPTSKHQMMSKPAPKRPPSRDIDHDRRLLKKKKPARRSEDEEAFDMLRQLIPPKSYSRYDDDDINMEAGFEDIQKEERRSARIAREEDERELKLLEEEERRERLRKNRKLSH
ncbi:unnamed protein product [Arabidopsis arenosa]|uniref:SPT2 chromatin protein n=1 Tax=Arabidopsis arenosa TaxID=38785 RepID=A0A8S2A560_ARAAE|nr:unnamed protein product [Arabidopsis arenosa]